MDKLCYFFADEPQRKCSSLVLFMGLFGLIVAGAKDISIRSSDTTRPNSPKPKR